MGGDSGGWRDLDYAVLPVSAEVMGSYDDAEGSTLWDAAEV